MCRVIMLDSVYFFVGIMIALDIVFMRVYYGYVGQCLFLRVYYTPSFKPSGPITVTISYSKIRD